MVRRPTKNTRLSESRISQAWVWLGSPRWTLDEASGRGLLGQKYTEQGALLQRMNLFVWGISPCFNCVPSELTGGHIDSFNPFYNSLDSDCYRQRVPLSLKQADRPIVRFSAQGSEQPAWGRRLSLLCKAESQNTHRLSTKSIVWRCSLSSSLALPPLP